LFIPACGFFIITAKEVITVLFTQQYIQSVPIFLIMLVTVPLNILLTQVIFRSFGEAKFLLKMCILAMLINIIIIYPLIKLFGLSGAALSFVISIIFRNVLEIIKIRNLLRVTFNRLLPWRKFFLIIIFTFVSLIFTYLIKNILFIQPIFVIIISFTVFSSAYLVMIIKSNVLSIEEKDLIKKYTYEQIKYVTKFAYIK
jgi:O-antigen/teichoic acid export membrane protein